MYAIIYTRKNPDQAAELFKHIYNIRTAAAMYVWDNVYMHDVKFRELIDENPTRDWGVIWIVGWSLYLKEKLGERNNHNNFSLKRKSSKKETICWRFNKGKCSCGSKCRFEHKCYQCFRLDHGAVNCKKGNSTHHHDDAKSGGGSQPN